MWLDPAQIPTVSIHCHPDGTTELVCKGDSHSSEEFKWTLDTVQPPTETCIKDGGKRVVLEQHVNGKIVCQILKGNKSRESSPIELMCDRGEYGATVSLFFYPCYGRSWRNCHCHCLYLHELSYHFTNLFLFPHLLSYKMSALHFPSAAPHSHRHVYNGFPKLMPTSLTSKSQILHTRVKEKVGLFLPCCSSTNHSSSK